ncbi:MAG TPA: 30S ribosomal protein S13, partial [Methanocorpusculum sp.]|nr:30S ribosomal protein S13 [Methanocorpusculum sp.]
DDINLMKKMRCYRGIRHENGLKGRGQCTKSTGRFGKIVGVSKRRNA